jgi:hypothetical protein
MTIAEPTVIPSLAGSAVERAALSEADIDAMLALFQESFEDATREIFVRDLANKDWVILLREAGSGRLQGFSTLALYETEAGGQRLSVVYSGDTIIRPAYWGTPELPRTWIKTVLRLGERMTQPLYWLLISSGYKTYRFLTVFYKEYYPRHDRPTPSDMQALMDELAGQRFGDEYHPELGIARFKVGATPLRDGVADVNAERLRDPHIAFFVARNPGWVRGDELVCLTRVHPDNFTGAGRRMAR